MNAIPPPPPLRADQPLTVAFTMTPPDWNIVVQLLTRAPYYIAAPMIAEIHERARAAPLDAVLQATSDDGGQATDG
jgi:hypothetical protein